MRLRLPALLVALAVLVAPASGSGTTAQPLRILFVGNSLTAANDLPGMVVELGRRHGRAIEAGTVAPGGYSLEDNWNADARSALLAGDWDVLVLQQGPSTLYESKLHLMRWATRFADEARARGTRPAVLCVWPDGGDMFSFRSVIDSYRAGARAARATFLPAGVAWRAALLRNRRLPLYGPDVFHPSPLGTYLAAAVVYRGLGLKLARLPRSFRSGAVRIRLTEARARALERAIADAFATR